MAESKAARGLLQVLVAGGSLPALPPGLSAEDVAESARIQGLGGLLLKAAEADPASWAGPLVAALAAERRGALVRSLGQVALAGRVLGLLEARGIRALPLKGAVLAETVYDVESDRPMSDVDVLALERWPEAVAVLKDAGFAEFARGDHAWAFRDPASETLVELHRSVSSCPGLFPLDPDAVWERTRPGRGQLPRLSAPEDLLVQLALHAAFQHGLVLSLVQWLDFRRVLEREGIETERLLAAANASRAEAPLAAALLAAEAVVATPLPPALREVLRAALPPGLRRWLAPRLEAPLAFVHPEPPALARVRWELMAGRRAELVWRTLAVPGAPGEEETLPRRTAAALGRAVRLAREQLPRAETPVAAAREDDPGAKRTLAPEVPFREEVLRECLASFPWVRLSVTGQCMHPALADGAKVHLVDARRQRPRLGDVVLARARDGLRLHRLVWGPPLAPPGMRWRTKADRGLLLDPPPRPVGYPRDRGGGRRAPGGAVPAAGDGRLVAGPRGPGPPAPRGAHDGGDAVSPSRLKDVYAHSPRVVSRRIGDEFVLVPLAGRGADIDSILNLNKVAAFIWEQLDGTRTGGEVVDALVERFEVDRAQAEEDYLDLLTKLRGLKAAVPAPGVEG